MAEKDGSSVSERLRALEAEAQRLRGEVADLRRLLAVRDESPPTPSQTMRTLLECPHCGGRRIYHVHRVLDRGSSNVEHHFSVTTKGFWSPKPVGRFSCWVCARCGFAEWYVTDPDTLEADDETIEVVDLTDAENGPYR